MSFLFLLAGIALIWNMTPANASDRFLQAAPAKVSELKVEVADSQVTAGAENLIAGMAQKAINFLGDKTLTHEQQRAEFKKLLDSNFDMETIGRFALGRYWRTATKQQQAEYIVLFKRMVIDIYSNRFQEYSGQELQVRGSRTEGIDTLVTSAIVPTNGQEVQVDWRVRYKNGRYKIVDVVVEGVSMTMTQRSDFASVIQRGGGSVDALLTHMRQ